MDKRIQLQLNNYIPFPRSLRDPVTPTAQVTELSVDLAKLYHHYYLDTFGVASPSPDPAYFEHTRFMAAGPDFRLLGDGIGASTSARRNKSTELGQAFCRWFLHDHLGITYFAHISELLDRQGTRGIGGCTIHRTLEGDTPDYLCAENSSKVFLAEAKGRYSSISFSSKAFSRWRDQFSRVRVEDSRGIARAIKGHIVATRFATEADSARIRSTIYAEDPESPGDGRLDEESTRNLASAVIGLHYGRIANKLNQPLLATALRYGIGLPQEIRVPVVIWKLSLDVDDSRRFVGGYFPGPNGESAFEFVDGTVRLRVAEPLRLDQPRGTFVGVEAKIFRSLVASCRSGNLVDSQFPRLERIDRLYSAISMLRDGTVVGPIEFFTPLSQEAL